MVCTCPPVPQHFLELLAANYYTKLVLNKKRIYDTTFNFLVSARFAS